MKWIKKNKLAFGLIILNLILVGCLISIQKNISSNSHYQNQPINQNVYMSFMKQEKFNLVFYKKGCPYCKHAEKQVVAASKNSKIPTVFVDVESAKGKEIIAKFHVNKPATIISVRNGVVNYYTYTKKVNSRYEAKTGLLKMLFEI